MKIINLTQNSADWHTWRAGGIGASDVPIILYESPFKGPYQLWQEKTGRLPVAPTKMAQAHGIASEDTARVMLQSELNMELLPISVMDEEAPYLRASYDGYNLRSGTIAEIKCPMSPKDHRRAKEGSVPYYYLLQMHQQMYIARAKEMIYYSWFQGEGIQLPVKFDEELWYGTALPEIQEFWDRVRNNEWPAPDGQTTYADSKELRQAALDWHQAEKMRQTAEYCGRIAEAAYKRACGQARNLVSGGVQCQQQTWKGRYMVQIDCESPEVQKAVLAACSPLAERINVQIKTVTWPPKIVFRFSETEEQSGMAR